MKTTHLIGGLRLHWLIMAFAFFMMQLIPVATLTKTAKALGSNTIDVSNHEGQLKTGGVPGAYSSGNITTYTELDYINYRFTLISSAASTGQMQVEFSEYDGNCTFFDGSFNLGTYNGSALPVVSVNGATPTVSMAGSASAVSGEWIQKINVTFSGPGTAVVNYYLKLGSDAGECNGSSQHSRLAKSDTPNDVVNDFKNIGNMNVPIPANDIIELPEITITKSIDENSDGIADRLAYASEWSFTLDGQSTLLTDANGQVVFENVKPDGAHVITESGLAGYSMADVSGLNCIIGSNNTAVATVSSGTTSIDANCNILNRKLDQPTIKLIKKVVNQYGTPASPDSFGINIDGNTVVSGVSNPAEIGKKYTINETGLTGYSFTSISGAGCPIQLGLSTVILSEGQDLVCTITNTAIAPKLIVKKHVINDNGGNKTAANFKMNVSASNPNPSTFNGDENGTTVTLNEGSYIVNETDDPGYKKTFSGDCNVNGGGMISIGETKTCIVTNDDYPGTLIINKILKNDNGGTKGVIDFGYQINGGITTAFEADGSNTHTVSAGIYNIIEPTTQGYTPKYDNCSNVYVTNGGTETCTITNDDDMPALTLIKKLVDNFNGGAKDTDWTLTATGPTTISGTTPVTSGDSFDAGNYSLKEESTLWGSTAFTSSDWTCIDNKTGATTSVKTALAISLGQSMTCTITNTSIQPKLTLIKAFEGTQYGDNSTVNDFGLTIGGTPVNSGDTLGVNANTPYSLNEIVKKGYQFVSITGNTKCPSALGGTITLALGDNISCTITNRAIQPKLTVTKVVVNDNGGTKTIADFPLFVNSTSVMSGATNSYNVGDYVVSETQKDGYSSKITGNCAPDGKIYLALGDNKSCTITNDDNTATLTLIKNLGKTYGSTAPASSWTLYAKDQFNTTVLSGTTGVTGDIDAGKYILSENGPSGWESTDWDCGAFGTLSNGLILLDLGDNVTCTITNNAIQPKLTLVKAFDGSQYGDTAGVNDFGLSVGGTLVQSGVATGFNVGEYTIDEKLVEGYEFVSISGDAKCPSLLGDKINLSPGDDITCTITNNAIQPKLTLIKNLGDLAYGSDYSEDDWLLTASGPTNFSGYGTASSDVNVGHYTLSESGPDGFDDGYGWRCSSNEENEDALRALGILNGGYNDSVDINLGDDITCYILNEAIQPKLTVIKKVINDNGGSKTIEDFKLYVGTQSVISGEPNGFDFGTYSVYEESSMGYKTTFSGDCDSVGKVTLFLGDEKTCTITNDDVAPSLRLVNYVINDDGGTAIFSDWLLTAFGPTSITGMGEATSGAGFASGTYLLSFANGPSGYTSTEWVCNNGVKVVENKITLDIAQNTVCTVVQNDSPKLVNTGEESLTSTLLGVFLIILAIGGWYYAVLPKRSL